MRVSQATGHGPLGCTGRYGRKMMWAPLLLTAVAQAAPIYLLGIPNDTLGFAEASSINQSGIVVGWCRPFTDGMPCYWDTNETPFIHTEHGRAATALNPHWLPIMPKDLSPSFILDIDTAGNVLGCACWRTEWWNSVDHWTGQLPAFAGWTPFPDVRPWTHTPTLSNAKWLVSQVPNPFEGPSIPQLNPVSSPEPGTLGAVLTGLALALRASLRRARSPRVSNEIRPA
jgi:hypothetical protein